MEVQPVDKQVFPSQTDRSPAYFHDSTTNHWHVCQKKEYTQSPSHFYLPLTNGDKLDRVLWSMRKLELHTF